MWFKIEKRIFQVEAFMITLALAVMLGAVVVQVFVRMLGMNSIGTTEIGMLMMSFITFIGTSAIVYTKDHITIELDQLFTSPKLAYAMQVVSTLIMIVFGVIFLGIAYTFFNFMMGTGEKTLQLGIPLTIPFGSMVIGTCLLIVHSISDVIRLIQNRPSNPCSVGCSGGKT